MTTTPHAELLTRDDIVGAALILGVDVTQDVTFEFALAIERALLARLGEQPPVAWMWQHDETGRVGFVDPWQVATGWQAANPRCAIVRPLYAHPPAAQPVAQGEREASAVVAALAMGWAFEGFERSSFLTDEANDESRFQARRTQPPFCSDSGRAVRAWNGRTPYEALARGCVALGLNVPGTDWQAARSAAQGAAQVPAGWKLVPIEPTDAMLDATTTCHKGRLYPQDNVHGPRAMRRREYVAMLAAAPTAPQAPAPVGAQDERAWLVEWKGHGYGPQWWGFPHTPGKNASWCEDANSAIRFARREDAERMRLHIIAVAGLTGLHGYERSITATEHEWPAVQSGHSMPTAPQAPALVPLTDAQIYNLNWHPEVTVTEGLRDFAREVERAHGITPITKEQQA